MSPTLASSTINKISGEDFDGIVYAEGRPYRWMTSSGFFLRTRDVVMVDETVVGQLIQMAIAYRDLGDDDVEITICRDGVQIGQYESGNMAEWSGDNAEILFGKRHISGSLQPGAIEGRIEEARIYDRALTCADVDGLAL